MSDCTPSGNEPTKCKACGLAMPLNGARRNCAALLLNASASPRIVLPRVAVGDLVETVLLRFGVTKQLVEKITRSPSCGCELRKARMNMFFYKVQHSTERLLNSAADFLFGV